MIEFSAWNNRRVCCQRTISVAMAPTGARARAVSIVSQMSWPMLRARSPIITAPTATTITLVSAISAADAWALSSATRGKWLCLRGTGRSPHDTA